MNEEKNPLQEKIVVDLEGKQREDNFEKVLIKPGEHGIEFVEFIPRIIPKYGNIKENETQIVATLKVLTPSFTGKEVPMFFSPVVTKSFEGDLKGKKYSNSKLYDLLDVATLLDVFANYEKPMETVSDLVEFLNKQLVGRHARVLVETVNKGTQREYSAGKKVYEVLFPNESLLKKN